MTSPSQARNAIKRCLKGLIDPAPSKKGIQQLWEHFNHRCAYCGISLEKASRKAHKDHLIAEADGGSNGLSNLVLSCGRCNGDEKLDLDWQQFLKMKCGNDQETYQERLETIENWISKNGGPVQLTNAQLQAIDAAYQRINKVFSECVVSLREIAKDDSG